jgi:hypothetical protein
MTAAELLEHVQALGVRVRPVGDRLRFEGPPGRITGELRAALARQKPELIALLRERADADAVADAAEPAETDVWRSRRAVILEAVRRNLSPSLRVWDDAILSPLLHWHLALAFERGDRNWRHYLPPALAPLSDRELVELVDWQELAALERTFHHYGDEAAPALSRGATRLAAWWNAEREHIRRSGC